MKLAISNIAWSAAYDHDMYDHLQKCGFSAIEIAPTRIFPEAPYDQCEAVKDWADKLQDEHNLVVASMQSIWYGRSEKLFADAEQRKTLSDYTKKAIDFAQACGSKNLVFGCPKNRNLDEGMTDAAAHDFFTEIAEYALQHQTCIGMEANPAIYNTNYVNTTKEALALVESVNNQGFLLNFDLGTVIENNEDLSVLEGKGHLINHVHISEPHLKKIEHRSLHHQLADILRSEQYTGYVSIEMGTQDNLDDVYEVIDYVQEIFG